MGVEVDDVVDAESRSRFVAYISKSTSHHFFSRCGGGDGRTDMRSGAEVWAPVRR
jgi:hypothetical protein